MRPPSQQVKDFERLYPGVWARVEAARRLHRPKYGYISVTQAHEILRRYPCPFPTEVDEEAMTTLCAWQLMLYAGWRMGKSIYRVSPRRYEELLDTDMGDELPCALFLHLPEWCVYVETPDYLHKDTPVLGYFFSVVEGVDGTPIGLAYFDGVGPIPVGIMKMSIEAELQGLFAKHPHMRPAILRAFALTLYLCSENAEFHGDGRPGNPSPTKTRHGPRVFPRDKVRVWDVGTRIGAELQAPRPPIGGAGEEPDATPVAEEAAAGPEAEGNPRARPRPHSRRAHFHGYWIKNENGERVLVAKWVGETVINARSADDLVETIHDVPDTPDTVPASKKFRLH